jgi:hypothetical protein
VVPGWEPERDAAEGFAGNHMFFGSVHMNGPFPVCVTEFASSNAKPNDRRSCSCAVAACSTAGSGSGSSLRCEGYDCDKTGAGFSDVHRANLPIEQYGRLARPCFAAFIGKMAQFKPDLVFISAGFDAHVDEYMVRLLCCCCCCCCLPPPPRAQRVLHGHVVCRYACIAHSEPLSSSQVNGKNVGRGMSSTDYYEITQEILSAMGKDVPVISVLEGGYTAEALQDGFFHHCKALFSPVPPRPCRPAD